MTEKDLLKTVTAQAEDIKYLDMVVTSLVEAVEELNKRLKILENK